MHTSAILKEIAENFEGGARRKFLPGLLISFVWLLQELKCTGGKFSSLAEFYNAHPRVMKTRAGNNANTLIVQKDADTTLSIRPGYEKIQRWIRAEHRRFDYPSAAPHATQAWDKYEHWLESLLALSDEELDDLVESVKQFVLEKLPAQDLALESVRREPSRFYLFLRDFDLTKHKGETSGAAYQGAVFGFIRADSSHLQVDVAKVRTGSKRIGRVGDVDAYDGETLVLTAEVKQFEFEESNISDVAEFSSLVSRYKALGLIVALDFAQGVREKLIELGLEPVSKKDLLERVRLWDPLKQQIAVQALMYYAQHKEKNSALLSRIRNFFKDIEDSTRSEKTLESALTE